MDKNPKSKLVYDNVCKDLFFNLDEIAKIHNNDKFRNKAILITGGTGFIAWYLTLEFLILNDVYNLGLKIILLVRDIKKATKKYGILLERQDLEIVIADVRDANSSIYKQNVDYIIHAASAADPNNLDDDPIGVFNSNVIGTENMAELAKQKNVEALVYISSFAVYGQIPADMPFIDENYNGVAEWNNNRACYSYGKRCAELLCGVAFRKSEVPIRIIRPGFVYGASYDNDARVYAEIIRNIAEEKKIVLKSSGYTYRTMIYVTDLVNGILCVLANGNNGQTYNIANEHISIREFANAAIKTSNNDFSELLFINPADAIALPPANTHGNMLSKKIQDDCGWKPLVSIDEGIKMSVKIVEWENKMKNRIDDVQP